jgi:4-carboxymuconolactone decarboxylase
MRLPVLPPKNLSDEQNALYATMCAEIKAHFHGFITEREDGALEGPWNPWLHFPDIGGHAWDLSKAVMRMSTIPPRCREIATLVTARHFGAAYELYAHASVAHGAELSESVIAAILAGQRPMQLEREEFVAFDVASALVAGGPLPDALFALSRQTFGDIGCAELPALQPRSSPSFFAFG